MAIIASIFGAPLTVFIDWVVMNVIAVPTLCAGSNAPKISPDVSVVAPIDLRRRSTLTLNTRRSSSIRKLSGFLDMSPEEESILGTNFNQDLNTFMRKLEHYRIFVLKDFQRVEFDEMWGINSETGHFWCEEDATSLIQNLKFTLRGGKEDVHALITKDLMHVRQVAALEMEYFDLQTVSDKERGTRNCEGDTLFIKKSKLSARVVILKLQILCLFGLRCQDG